MNINTLNHYEDRNKELAIQGTVKLRLEEILPLLTKNRLSEIASLLDLSGRSKLKKDELATELTREILSVYQLDSILLLSREEEFQFYQQLLQEPFLQNNDIPPSKYLHFMNHGILFTFFDQDKLYFVIPEEIRTVLHQLDWDALLWTWSWQKEIIQYISAAVNLYGICTSNLLLDIYNAQSDQSLTELDLKEISDFHLKRTQDYIKIAGYYTSQYFEYDNLGELYTLLERIQNKPHYIPKKEVFLKYSDALYYEKTPQLLQLRLFILNQLCEDTELVDNLIDDIQLACSMEKNLQSIMNELDSRDIIFDNMEQAKRFITLATEVYNHTRIWSNNGYTPAELSALTKGSKNKLNPGQHSAAVKVGRNDPCPCGSGKKFKKCCGS